MKVQTLLILHSQLYTVYIRAVTEDFVIIEEFQDLAELFNTITGKNISFEVMKILNKFHLNPKHLCGLTTDGVHSTAEKKNSFTQLLIDSNDLQGVVIIFCFTKIRCTMNINISPFNFSPKLYKDCCFSKHFSYIFLLMISHNKKFSFQPLIFFKSLFELLF